MDHFMLAKRFFVLEDSFRKLYYYKYIGTDKALDLYSQVRIAG